jgi:hypothetical protein
MSSSAKADDPVHRDAYILRCHLGILEARRSLSSGAHSRIPMAGMTMA